MKHLLLTECFFPLGAYVRHDDDDEQRQGNDQEREAQRVGHEHRRAAPAEQHGAAQVLLQHRSEHEAEQQGRRFEVELDQRVADQPNRAIMKTSNTLLLTLKAPMQQNAMIAGNSRW